MDAAAVMNETESCSGFVSNPKQVPLFTIPTSLISLANHIDRSSKVVKRQNLSSYDVGSVMNRDFVFNLQEDRPSVWSRASSTLNKWLWGALCCGQPGVPCYFCTCCEKQDAAADRERPSVNQATATAERMMRPHRPHAPGCRKSTPEMLSAVRCALSQLQGEPAPPRPVLVTAMAHTVTQNDPG